MFILNGRVIKATVVARKMREVGYKAHVSHVYRVMCGERPATKEFTIAFGKVFGLNETKTKELLERMAEAHKQTGKMQDYDYNI